MKVTLELTPKEAYMVQEILQAHREHCRKVKPELVELIYMMGTVLDRIRQARRASVA